MILILATLSSFLTLAIGHSESTCPSQTTLAFYRADNLTLRNHIYLEVKESSAVICGRECSMDYECASFNYYAERKFCELSDTTRIQHPRDFVHLPGAVYFDKNFEMPSFLMTPYDELSTVGPHDELSTAGIYTTYPAVTTDWGGWIVFQRRQDGSVDFYRTWDEYKYGFGNLSGEFWLGNEALRNMTKTGQWQLRVDLWDWENNTAWAEYGEFAISGDNYTLYIGSYNNNSTANDSLTNHNASDFTTKDRNNDVNTSNNCAYDYQGAWWFNDCYCSYLNGKYYNPGCLAPNGTGIHWLSWKDESLKRCTMKIKLKLRF